MPDVLCIILSFLGDALLAAFATEYESIRELADRP